MSTRKPLYQMTLAEQAALAQPVDRALQADKLNKGLYNIYQSDEDKKILIQEHKNKIEHIKSIRPPDKHIRSGSIANEPTALCIRGTEWSRLKAPFLN